MNTNVWSYVIVLLLFLSFINGCTKNGPLVRHEVQGSNKSSIEKSTHNAALIHASMHGSADDVVEALKAKDADISFQDDSGMTALMHAAIYNDDPDILSILVEHGADVNQSDFQGRTALHHAMGSPFLRVKNIEKLAQMKADLNAKDLSGCTPIFHGLNLYIVQSEMRPAKENNSHDYMCDDVGLAIERLVHLGADINAKNKYCETPLMFAAANNNTNCVSLLVNLGADLNAKNLSGRTPLMYAVMFNADTNVTKHLIQLGANVNDTDSFGKTALEYHSNEPTSDFDEGKYLRGAEGGCGSEESSD